MLDSILVSQAHAADAPAPVTGTTTTPPVTPEVSGNDLMFQNLGMIAVLCLMFYFLLIMPQQRRFKEHSNMLQGLKKGDKVVTSGGLIGTIEKLDDGGDEAVINLGDGVKVTTLRSSITKKHEPKSKKAANDQKK